MLRSLVGSEMCIRDRPKRDKKFSTPSIFVNVLNFGQPGILYSLKRFLVNDFEVSIWARFFFGPITPISASHKESATPCAKGSSGPIIAILIFRFIEKSLINCALLISIIFTSLQISDMPGLLLLAKQYISFSFFDLFKDLIIACSLAPDPIRKFLP